MTGFLKSLFGKKNNQEEVKPPKKDNPGSTGINQNGAYFLSSDDAKTFGDIEYMRTAKTIKRSYAKGDERVRQISALSSVEEKNNSPSESNLSAQNSSGFQSPSSEPFPSQNSAQRRRTADSSLDQFRSMAKEIRKR